jgi:hypothetical protein
MPVLIDTFTAGNYTARVFDNATVEIETDGVIFDRPGPWGTVEGAAQWAEAIVGKYALDGHRRTDSPTP